MSSIELSEESCIDLLKRYIDIGYKSTGSVNIKEGAIIHRYFRVLKKQEKNEEIKTDDIYKILFKVLDIFNSSKAYSLDDAAVIDRIVTYIEKNILDVTEENIKKV